MTAPKKKYSKIAHLIPDVMQMRAEGQSITRIGAVLGLSKQRVSQISMVAKAKAKSALHSVTWHRIVLDEAHSIKVHKFSKKKGKLITS